MRSKYEGFADAVWRLRIRMANKLVPPLTPKRVEDARTWAEQMRAFVSENSSVRVVGVDDPAAPTEDTP